MHVFITIFCLQKIGLAWLCTGRNTYLGIDRIVGRRISSFCYKPFTEYTAGCNIKKIYIYLKSGKAEYCIFKITGYPVNPYNPINYQKEE